MTALIHNQAQEAKRLEALRQCRILDTPPEEAFDDLTRLAAHICGVPIAAVSLIDAERQWFKSIQGLDISETHRDEAFCAHTIGQTDLMIVPDAHEDGRFVDNPLVTGDPNIRFYAGAPLVTQDGHALGSLCVIDRTPRQLSPEQEAALRLLARQAAIQLEMTRHAAAQEQLIAERTQAEEALRRSEAWLNEAQRLARVGSWEFDIATGRIVWSQELFRLFEMDPTEGEPTVEALMTRYHPDDVAMHQEITHHAVEDGQPYEFDIRILRPDGSVRWVHASGRGERDDTGGIVRLVGTVADIHDRKCAEEKLRKSEETLRTVMEGAPAILYAVDVQGLVTLSEGAGLTRLGLMPGEVVGRSTFGMYPDGGEAEHQMRRALAGESRSYDSTVNGLYYHNELRPQRDADGNVTGVIALAYDMTDRWRAEETVRRSEERFRVLFEQSSDAHLLLGEAGIIDCNHAAVTLLGCADKSQLLSMHPAALSPEFQPDGRRSDEKAVEMDRQAHENGSHCFEWTHRKSSGEEFPAEITLTPVMLHDRPVLLVVLHDLSERKRAEQQAKDYAIVLEFQKEQLEAANAELESLATTDGLTGLKNHRAFQERLSEEQERVRRQGTPLSVVLLDVDKFKDYNDTHGHPAGDKVLRKVARLMRSGARETDLVARYGGEEFVLILPQTDHAAGLLIAERIRKSIEANAWSLRPVTASFGVATLTSDDPHDTELVARADQALYRSKQAGRNRVTGESLP